MSAFRNVGRWTSALVLTAWCSFASAFSISLLPSSGTVTEGVPFGLDVVIGGLAADSEFVTAYDLLLGVPAGVDFVSAASTDALGPAGMTLSFLETLPPVSGPTTLALIEASLEPESFFQAPTPQADPVTVAHLSFIGTAPGSADFTLAPAGGGAIAGSLVPDPSGSGALVSRDLLADFPSTFSGASLTIAPRSAVPEPATLLLAALALLGLALARRRAPR